MPIVELLPEIAEELKKEAVAALSQSGIREEARLRQIEQQKRALPLIWQETGIDPLFDELTAYLKLQDAEPDNPFPTGVQEINGVWVYERGLRWRDRKHFCQITATLYPDDRLTLLGEKLITLTRINWEDRTGLNRSLARIFLTPLKFYRLEKSIWGRWDYSKGLALPRGRRVGVPESEAI